jgi:asparagine synthase (glutamine-hydrolysing)
MCGIAGFSGQLQEELLRDAEQAIAHRGPDGAGVWFEPGCGLAHRRLSIIDLSEAGSQPMTSADGSATIIYNGEIYNYRELRAELAGRNAALRSHSDTEVLLHLYRESGEKMLSRLNGIFAFAIWDARDRSLFIARDHFGVKPLYWAQTGRGFAFASEIKALLRIMPELRELDPVALHRYLTFLYCPGERTPFRDVKKLLPGEAMRVRGGKIERRWSWYSLPHLRPQQSSQSAEAALRGTEAHLRQAVHRQMVADVPVGAFLSGGLDSSAVVAFAREQSPDIRCFSMECVGPQDAGFVDDLPYARRVAKHLGVSLEVVPIDSSRMAADLERMVWQLDEPLADPAPLNVLYISQLARQHGIKVLLSGAGGDDLFSGYRRHVAVRHHPYWRWLPRIARAGLERATRNLDQGNATTRRLTKLFAGAGLSSDEHLAHYFRWNRDLDLLPLYSRTLRDAAREERVDAPLLDFLEAMTNVDDPLERMLGLEQRFYLPDHNLTYTDKMAMAAGVEVRVPFLDPDLVDYAATIPGRLKQRGRHSKWILKRAMEPYLPHDVIYRPKAGFGAPLRRWMRSDLQPLMDDVLSADSLVRRGLFDPAGVQRLVHRTRTGESDGAYALLSVMSIEIWCRRFLDMAPQTPELSTVGA